MKDLERCQDNCVVHQWLLSLESTLRNRHRHAARSALASSGAPRFSVCWCAQRIVTLTSCVLPSPPPACATSCRAIVPSVVFSPAQHYPTGTSAYKSRLHTYALVLNCTYPRVIHSMWKFIFTRGQD